MIAKKAKTKFKKYIKAMFNKTRRQSKLENGPTYKCILSRSDFFPLLLFVVAANLFIIYFINQENYIYYWDYANYWLKYINIGDLFKYTPLAAIRSVFFNIEDPSYSNLAAFLLMPFGFLFGTERLPYILSIANIFAFPAAVSFLLLYKKIIKKLYGDLPLIASFIVLFTILTFSLFWHPLLSGYVGVGGIFVINLILLIYLKHPFPAQSFRTLLCLGLLISMLVLFQRWYAFWIVSFFITLLISEFIFSFTKHRFDHKRYLVSLMKILFVICISAIFLLIVAAPLVLDIFKTDYSDIYSAYKYFYFQPFEQFFTYFGLFYIILFLLGSIYALSQPRIRKFSFFLLLQGLIIPPLFLKIHGFGCEHYYLLQPMILLFISLFAIAILLKAKTKTSKIIICSVYILISLLSFSVVFSEKASQYTEPIKYVFPDVRHYPLKRNDINEIGRILNVMEGLSTDPNDRVYILASSRILNYNILQYARLTLKRDEGIENRILGTHEVDKRDGFPLDFLTAKYVVVAYPIQYHLRPEDQLVIGVPAKSIINRQNIGTSYNKLPYEFVLDDDVRVYIYKKVSPFRKTDMDSLSEIFRKYYPDRPYLYKIPDFFYQHY